ncbi:MAG: cell division protein ZipA C-terminal FtsZ-binding domain-containing protein [Gammaproteobacteria bacterium]|nr:cell division protein ZipA C-terminal FtsZ-binding domain-containing protein [Gammaproteobacteria bacterium]MCW8910881.1 cell division protein ZipA C-terminal FtsZ-binding domain-containing protein [Gammaproteobacteria bacterium]MCW9005097.1 cell division protein ZipA C-terminal FtsZ-binding domain-containing protein [Gammaproteobacteria bacterium]MCW9057170.1 cell division protein ZipA C-terminal FtsZ-binding domain-containing protein [Gammaproteobacteria bacterium]
MDELRWILLGLGVVLIIAVYFWGRYQNQSSVSIKDTIPEAPSFSAMEDDDRWVDGVGPVRVVVKDDVDDSPAVFADTSAAASDEDESIDEHPSADENVPSESEKADSNTVSDQPAIDDVVSLFLVVAKDKIIKGEQIYSACLGNNLQYGEMKIFHRINDDGETVFSLSDMMKPGWFDIEQINNHKTRGVSLFAQLSMVSHPVEVLDDMLLCAHSVANLLGAQLCGQDRMLLNESSVKLMREKAKRFNDSRQPVNV